MASGLGQTAGKSQIFQRFLHLASTGKQLMTVCSCGADHTNFKQQHVQPNTQQCATLQHLVSIAYKFFLYKKKALWYCTGGSNQQSSILDHTACIG